MLHRIALLERTLALTASLIALSCAPATGPAPVPKVAVGAEATAGKPPEPPPPDIHVLMINGGGNERINYRSHLLHLEQLYRLLARAGVERDRVSVFASDGSNPTPDLATREIQPEAEFWRIKGTRLEHPLRVPLEKANSKIEGVKLEPATKLGLASWFGHAAATLRAGDTLLVYVTDHGTRSGADPLDNRITLWGDGKEGITVRELGELLGQLEPGVRVVTLMSQCFSGGFAELAKNRLVDGEPSGDFCGYFSSTADRPAYGCFPENYGKDNVGYSFDFIRSLDESGRFDVAHEAVLVRDDTPDVPLRTSDVYLESLLTAEATRRSVTLGELTDALLREAFDDSAAWEHDARLLDRVAQATGSFSPRSLGELEELGSRLPAIDEQLKRVKQAWKEALADANTSNLDRFVGARPPWQQRLDPAALAKLAEPETRGLTAELLGDLAGFTAEDPEAAQRVQALATREDGAAAASYRMQVRLAVVLRMKNLLLSVAGRHMLAKSGSAAQQAAYERLTKCEDLSLPRLATTERPSTSPGAVEGATFPPFEEDLRLTREALPGWMGIRFKDPGDDLRRTRGLPNGASLVALVYPDSPAAAAGLEAGDIVTGPPGDPFSSRNQIRAWTMLSKIGAPGTLEILRGNARKQITLVPDPFPMKWPSLPGPTKVGDAAPRVKMDAYRGPVDRLLRGKHLLYFWATWCGPCKAAVPELMAYERQTGVPVIAVTDEGSKVLDPFIKNFPIPFPKAIASDRLRSAFVAYGVGGTPTFVLVGASGNVEWSQVGYSSGPGLSIPGWKWAAPASAPQIGSKAGP